MHLWKQFVQSVSAHIDPVLASMLYSTDVVAFDVSRGVVEVVTLKKFVLFQDLFLEQKHIYQQYLNRIFGFQVMLSVQFTKVEAVVPVPVRIAPVVADAPVAKVTPKIRQTPVQQPAPQFFKKTTSFEQKNLPAAVNERVIDVSDTKKWKITHMLLQNFGGTVREIIKDTNHEFDA